MYVKDNTESLGVIFMKKIISIISLFMLVFCTAANAESPVIELNEQLFADAKQALVYFEAADYESAAALLGFADAAELEKFITGNYTTFGADAVQTTVSVAWWTGSAWMIAVPLYEPEAPEVEALVLLTNNTDCSTFCGYTYARWGDVEAVIAECDYVTWNEEYISEDSMVIFMDN